MSRQTRQLQPCPVSRIIHFVRFVPRECEPARFISLSTTVCTALMAWAAQVPLMHTSPSLSEMNRLRESLAQVIPVIQDIQDIEGDGRDVYRRHVPRRGRAGPPPGLRQPGATQGRQLEHTISARLPNQSLHHQHCCASMPRWTIE